MNRKISKLIFVLLFFDFLPIYIDLVSPSTLGLTDVIRIVLAIILFLLGLSLLVIILKNLFVGLPRRFLLLTAANAMVIPLAIILHNLSSGLSGNREDIFFFLIAEIICPLGLVAGVIGTLLSVTIRPIKKPVQTP